jgi:long-chain acyl-CoA synthetase
MLTFCVMMQGNHAVLIPISRELDTVIKEMNLWRWIGMSGFNTLFVQRWNHAEFKTLDFCSVKATLPGCIAVTACAAKD